MKKIPIIILFLFISHFSYAQITFQKTLGGTGDENAYSVKQTTDGGYIIVGETNSFTSGNKDVYLVKTDVNGNYIWTKTYGGPDTEHGYSVQKTTDGGFIVTGTSFGVGGSDIFLIKTDINGDTLWTKVYGGTTYDVSSAVQQTTDGGYIVAGRTSDTGSGYADVYLIKMNPNGDVLWTKTFGGQDSEESTSVQQTTDGGYIITGYTLSFGAGDYDIYLIKTDANGSLLWSKTIGEAGYEVGNSVQQTSDGGYIVAGYTSNDFYLIKTDMNGDTLWTKSYGGIDSETCLSVNQIANGGYIMLGYTKSFGIGNKDVYLINTNSNGDILWTKTFGDTTLYREGYSVMQTIDGGYIICGNTKISPAANKDVYLIKTDSLGNSGCIEGSTTPTVISPPTQVSSPATIVDSLLATSSSTTFVIGGGGITNSLCTPVGTNEILTELYFEISPNPSFGNIKITFKKMIVEGKVEIVNILGEKIFTETILSETIKEIIIPNLSTGLYFVNVFDGEKYICKKIIAAQN